MTPIAWIIWAAASVAYNIALTMNSRAKVSRSWRWNACSSFIVGIFYVGSMVGIGNEILTGSHRQLAAAIILYGLMGSLGSVIGQEIVLRLKFFQRIEGRND